MPPSVSNTEKLVSSLHRGILGLLLGMFGLLGVGLAKKLLMGDYLLGTVGVVLALGAGYWILSLFQEGLRER
ncbi:hypothetical protein HLRTI_001743 [Halorhabdus tiamatea SARL4B]|uniref:Uncharacterized protein n=1 Tax=Halorhabdus tiamatea SARL4B TaxID=1033806 RepID=U2FD39_9EURY|nr:hypothetical protein [Halorhabdus tiamatea]ERJ06264.1 hypothetical protein HLRTI_001743 [Halorhabdus tiamatea SARL4B]